MAEVSVEKKEDLPTVVPDVQPVKKSLDADAFQNFLQGKRHLLVKDYTHAVQSLAKACELHTEHYGDMAPECGEVFFHYGKALFYLYQQQSGIFGDTVPDGSEDEEENESGGSEEEKDNDGEDGEGEEDKDNEDGEEEKNNEDDIKEDDSESVSSSKEDEKMDTTDITKSSADAEDSTKSSDAEDGTKQSADAEDGTKQSADAEDGTKRSADAEDGTKRSADAEDGTKSSADAEDGTTNSASLPVANDSVASNSTSLKETKGKAADLAQAGPSTSQSKSPKAEDEISDLQLAWETLETAKQIFQKQGPDRKDAQMKIAEILLILGGIGLENDLYIPALKDLTECLAIWQRYLKSDDRRIAETYYQLGLAYQLNEQSDKALESFQNTIDVLNLRIDILKKQTVIEQNEDGFDIDPKLEIAELEALLPDIKLKLEDAKELDKETQKAIEELNRPKPKEVTASPTEDAKPVMNISHLLKRKKPEESENGNKEGVKKIKLSSPVNSSDEQRQQSTSEVAPLPTA